ncbi:A disintegrin and metalloproteinase with thrombospondin motifs 12 isoform X1 [Alligator mississippiensis]|uniref:A disintegrin and metalloproteinase with thrombospondin motifs 12 isoform X1 n=1 Tax=Alligator mississippiensis TaxID=8496 RepID=UPI0009076D82|nr:A disintegrin and metalloproteinase with thrombospondin motifs 12 isoform X1 [Alligator mississippiensis]
MPCVQRSWIANFSFWVQFLHIPVLCYGRNPPPGRFFYPDKKQEHFIKALQDYHVVGPTKVDANGCFLSYNLQHHTSSARRKRDLSQKENFVYYKISHKEKNLFFNLTVNEEFLSNNYVLERRYGNYTGAKVVPRSGTSCHFIGVVLHPDDGHGTAVISTCNGLTGYFHLPREDYFIEPVQKYPVTEGTPHLHIIYRAHVPQNAERQRREAVLEKEGACGLNDTFSFFKHQEHRRERWEGNHVAAKTLSRRSVSKERWVETLVVADSKMIEYHGSDNVESYILTIMNMVTGLFHDPSIGNAIHIVLVRLILLEEEEQGLKIVHHADKTLASFCKWQKSINPKSDVNPIHHDVAVLITRKDICAGMNRPCETLGLSHLSGMCQPHRSCNINEDSGLPLAFTIAHELGHSFGIQHDGKENDCEPAGKRPYIMSRQLQYDPSPLTWSQCSKEYITRFLDRGWGFCLDDIPKKKILKSPFIAPGVIYDVHHQCQLQYGPNATFCEEVDNICQTLWCSVKGSCRSKLDAAADGTRCGENKWCFTRECITVGKNPEAINGGWGTWSSWSHCTRTCGAGVQSSERQCSNPEPQFGGKYCTGERKRYRMCNISPCQGGMPTFRQMQCSEFDTVPYKNEFYQWIPIYTTANPCELHCRPVDAQFSQKMLDAVLDGTPCFEGNNGRDICINGMCKTVGCDYEINSNATEDQCGVCLGDGSACQTVMMMFNQSEGVGYVDIGLIPKGARDIRVLEVTETENFLAVRSEDPEKYYLNGGFIIQWSGEYKVAGTVFLYARKGDLENLTASGPTNESVWIQLLFQENNRGIKYEYTIRKEGSHENDIGEPEFFWQYGDWTDCSVTCGRGIRRQIAHCVRKGSGVIKNTFCDPEMQPNGRQKKCSEKDCPPRWWAGEWQKCSTTCGPTGQKKRTVLCIQTVGSDEQALAATECQHLLKPKIHASCNRDVLCPSDWTVSNWTECTVTCGGGVRTRNITCAKNNDEPCDISKRPNSKALCGLQQCPARKLMISPLTPERGKILIRKTAGNPRRGPPGRKTIPKPRPRVQVTTKAPETRSTLTLAPTSAIPVNSSKAMDNMEIKISQNTSTRSDDDYNPPSVFNGSSSHQNSTFCPISNSSKSENIRDAKNISNTKPSTTSEGIMVPRGVTSHSFSFTGNPEVTPGYDYLTEESDDTDWSVGGSEKPTAIPDTISNPAIKTESTRPKASSDIIKNESQTPKVSPTFIQYESSIPSSSSIVAETMAPLTTANPRNISVQIDTPVTNMAPTEGSVTIKPTVFSDILRKQNNNRMEMEHTDKITYSQSTRSPSPGGAPKNQSIISEEICPDTTELDHPTVSNGLGSGSYWIVGNWSECSTTCGLGAFWRHVECSSKNESDCQHVKKPDPARRCYLRPCANWKTGNWSKCSTNCGGGFRTRDIQCTDVHDKRVLRPFHCQLVGHKPQLNIRCNTEPCMEWRAEPWNECSRTCGGGWQERHVYCPVEDYCDWMKRPNSTAPCREQPCTQWVNGTWNSCTVSCGGGIQQRAVMCVNTENYATENQSMCEHEPKPPESQKCNLLECRKSPGLLCNKDNMSVHFCQKLKEIGKCLIPSIQTQCCFTCSQTQISNKTRHGKQQEDLKEQHYAKPRRKSALIKKRNSRPVGH